MYSYLTVYAARTGNEDTINHLYVFTVYRCVNSCALLNAEVHNMRRSMRKYNDVEI